MFCVLCPFCVRFVSTILANISLDFYIRHKDTFYLFINFEKIDHKNEYLSIVIFFIYRFSVFFVSLCPA